MADEFRNPNFVRGDWRLSQNQWEDWKSRYLSGRKLPCKVCKRPGDVVLSAVRGVATYPCGHVMELPENCTP